MIREMVIVIVEFLFINRRIPRLCYVILPWLCLASGTAGLIGPADWRKELCILYLFVYAALVLYYRTSHRHIARME